MSKRTFYYSRDQKVNRQIDAFKKMGADDRDIIIDKVSGKNLDRTGYQALKKNLLRDGDTLVIESLDRLSRNKADIKKEMEFFRVHKIRVKVLDIPTTLMNAPEGQEWIFEMTENILIEVLGSFAENERKEIKKLQAEGIASAKANGIKFGRPSVEKPDNWKDVFEEWKKGNITAVEAMKQTGLKRSSFYKFVNDDEK